MGDFLLYSFMYFPTFYNDKVLFLKIRERDFPGGEMVKNLPANAGDTDSIPGPGRSHMPRSN